ncbi:MAG: winged helix-turn-helix transcriptional regulator [Acidobacteria bacterium]|nr:winged helix-turn-helix transcriptional regulator [Acidobacteriota bacterium]
MASACRAAGLAPPLLEEIGTRFRVTLSVVPTNARELDERDQKILASLSGGKGKSTQQLAEMIGLSPRATRTRLRTLIERGLLVEIGSGPQDPRRLYFSSEKIETASK